MEPQVRYAKTSDGVSIAYAQAGRGPPLLVVPFIFQTHITEIWRLPNYWLPKLANHFQLTWYDCRSSGLSGTRNREHGGAVVSAVRAERGGAIEEDGDLFGSTVILASRIAAKAEGGEILVANAVRELCAGKGFLFADRGEFVAKGFDEAVRVYEVRWRE
ncbi:MAG: adenylate/guanylate cyclase domain-containing protein [Dehalococcoidia bacterium]